MFNSKNLSQDIIEIFNSLDKEEQSRILYNCGLSFQKQQSLINNTCQMQNNINILPCKVGDIIYAKYSVTNTVESYIVDTITYYGVDEFKYEAHLKDEDGYTVDIIIFGQLDIGLTVFIDETIAKQVLDIN